jgi:hypothetical protein
MKYVLLVEGDTEARALPKFLKRWLDPQLRLPIRIDSVDLGSWSVVVDEAPRRTRRYFSDRKQADEIIAVIGLIDLHGPNHSNYFPPNVESVEDRCRWVKQKVEREVRHPQFRQFLAVHEVEAWLLSEPHNLPAPVKTSLPGRAQHPEQVDFDEPPKQLLQRLYHEKCQITYKQTVHGVELFGKLDPKIAYQQCPMLHAMLDEMLALAKKAGL